MMYKTIEQVNFLHFEYRSSTTSDWFNLVGNSKVINNNKIIRKQENI